MSRRVELEIMYNAQDITTDVTPFLTGFRFEDYSESKTSDNLTIDFQDVEGLWRSGWLPSRGAKVSAKLTTKDWFAPGNSMTLETGLHELDEIGYKGPPNVCEIGAVAIGITSAIRREKKTQAWENIDTKTIAEDIAGRNGFELFFDGDPGPVMDRYDQRDQTDLEFLGDVCDKSGFSLKATDGRLVVFKEKQYDANSVEVTITRNEGGYKDHSFRITSADVYTSCTVQYLDHRQRLLIAYTYQADPPGWDVEKVPVGKELKLNCRCNSLAEAEETAKAALRDKNKRETTGSITVMGNPSLRAGLVLGVKGFGRFDTGQYMIETSRHDWSRDQGYETSIDFRGVLDF